MSGIGRGGIMSVFNASILRGVRSLLPANPDHDISEGARWPQTQQEWVERYTLLEDMYLGLPYRLREIRRLKLFRALDPTGKTIAVTRRLTRDVAHVVNTDARAMSAGIRLVSSHGEGKDEDAVTRGRAIWTRSQVVIQSARWARMSASMGDIFWEAVRLDAAKPFDVHIVGYDPRHVQIEYDVETNTKIVRATIRIPVIHTGNDEEILDTAATGSVVEYKRVLTADNIEVFLSGKKLTAQSGKHNLGVVPLVHAPFIPWSDPAHGLWAAQGLQGAITMIDSLMTQMLAVGIRYASPLWVARGFQLRGGTDLNFGRVLAIPADGKLEAVAPDLTGIDTLIHAAESARNLARETLPEFLFSEAGGNASGTALNFRATAFESKMLDVRSRWYPALTLVTEYALALEDDREFDQDTITLAIDAPPVLPVNTQVQVRTLIEVKEAGGIRHEDFIAHLQTLNIVPAEIPAAEYSKMVLAERDQQADKELAGLMATADSLRNENADEIEGDEPELPEPPQPDDAEKSVNPDDED